MYIAKYCVVSAARRSVQEWHIDKHSKEKRLMVQKNASSVVYVLLQKYQLPTELIFFISKIQWNFNLLKPTGNFKYHRV